MAAPRIYTETPLIPYIIAEQVAGRNEEAVTYLEKKAERIYENNGHFREQLNKKGYDQRETLKMFMAHWLLAFNDKPYQAKRIKLGLTPLP